MYIDADTHVHESPETWEYIPKQMEEFRPVPMNFVTTPVYMVDRPGREEGTFVDGQIYARHLTDDAMSGTTADTRELRDVAGRVRDMDALGVDVQVLFPTLLLPEVTKRPEIDAALCEAYNRWVADACDESGGRIHWTAVLPNRSMPDSLREMRRAKEAGAIGIFKRGVECDDRHASDPYFFPLYAQAEELELPICIHVGRPYSGNATSLTKTQTALPNDFYVQDAFLSIVRDGIPDRFPNLRFGFIEASAGWVPHVAWMAGFVPHAGAARDERDLKNQESLEQFLAESRIFVTCEFSEDLPDLVGRFGDTAIMVGSDYSHGDRSAVAGIHQAIAEREGLSATSLERILTENPKRFYAL